MSTKAVSWVLHQVQVEPITKMILVALAENADEYGVAWPSQITMARSACVSVISVKRKMKFLEQAGVLSVRRKRVGKNKTQNKYRLHLEKTFDLLPASTVNTSSTPKIDPDFEGIPEIPLNREPEPSVGISETPLKVSQRDLQNVEGISADTFKGISSDTRTTKEPSLRASSNNTTTSDRSVFEQQAVPSHRAKFEIGQDWIPSDHVFEQLEMIRNIDRGFAESVLPEFVTYYHGTVFRQGEYDAKFLKHAIYRHEKATKTPIPTPLPQNWEPDQETTKNLRTNGVAIDFISTAITEFRLYWRERGESRVSWNAQFFNRCMQIWNSSSASTELATGGERAIMDRFTDRSWAE